MGHDGDTGGSRGLNFRHGGWHETRRNRPGWSDRCQKGISVIGFDAIRRLAGYSTCSLTPHVRHSILLSLLPLIPLLMRLRLWLLLAMTDVRSVNSGNTGTADPVTGWTVALVRLTSPSVSDDSGDSCKQGQASS